MNTGQTILTLGSMMLLSILVMNILRMSNNYEDIYNDTRTMLEATALTSSLIEQASQLPFDEVSWDSTIVNKDISDFTVPGSLGPDAGETADTLYDDFDDYDGYTVIDTTLQSIYSIACTVDYVSESTPNSISLIKTYYKRLTVTTTNQVTQDSVKLQYIHGYWYFN